MEATAMLRPIMVFVHVAAAMGIFGALAMESISQQLLRRAAGADQLRAALQSFRTMRWLATPSLITTLASGIYLTVTRWGWQASWITVAFSGLILTAIIGGTTTGVIIARLGKGLSLTDRNSRILTASLTVRTFLLLGIVFLMTVKPPAEVS